MYFPPTEILKIAYFLQPWARRAHRNPQNYIFLPKVGSIYPIKTFIPQMMASYIQYFWQFLTIFENFVNFFSMFAIFDNFGLLRQLRQFFTILKRQSLRLVTFETPITVPTIENLNSWQSLESLKMSIFNFPPWTKVLSTCRNILNFANNENFPFLQFSYHLNFSLSLSPIYLHD